jgi:2-hydroxymuconate-semialdehyde hydrolase
MNLDKQRVRLAGGEVAYVDEGQGPAVILLHGFPTSSHLWRDLVPILAPRFRTVAPDLLGYGDSSKPERLEVLTVEAQARMVRELVERLDLGQPAMVGHDIGGGVAQLVALDGTVGTMVLVDSVAFDSWPIEGVRMLQDVRPEQVDLELVRGVVRTALELGMGRPDRLSTEDNLEFLRPWEGDPAALFRAARAIDGRGLIGAQEPLAELGTRVLVVWGEDDPFQPVELAERLGEALPGATVAVLPGCAHFVTEDAPEVVFPLIADYLRHHHLGQPHRHDGAVPVDLGVSFERPPPADPES